MEAQMFMFKSLLMLSLLPFGAAAQQVSTIATLPASGMAVDTAQNLYVSDFNQKKVFRIAPGGTSVLFSNIYMGPVGIVTDANGNVIVADGVHIDSYPSSGAVAPIVAGAPNGPIPMDPSAPLSSLSALARHPSNGTLYVSQSGNANRIRKVDVVAGTISTLLFDWNIEVRSLAVDSASNVYYSVWPSNTVRKISPAGTHTLFAGSGSPGYADGAGAAAAFNDPRGLAVDAQDNVYVADFGNNRIRKITPAGVVSTYAGSGANAEIDGNGVNAAFKSPHVLAIDALGTLYVADRGANTIRKILPNRRRINDSPLLTANALALGGLLGVNPGVACGQWGVMKLKHYDAVNDVVCGGSYTVRAGNSLEFNINYGCVTNGNTCVTAYKASITTPSGANSVVTISNPAQWSYAFTQAGTYLVSFQASCNGLVCQNTCSYGVVVK